MSVRRKLADAFRALPNRGLAARYLRSHPNAVNGSVYVLAAEALEQLAKPPDPARTWARSKLARALNARALLLEARVAELEAAAEQERAGGPPREDLINMVRGLALRGITDYAGVWSWLLALEAIAARALDHVHDAWSDAGLEFEPFSALGHALHEAGFFDAEEGAITHAGEALQLRVARRGAATDHAVADIVAHWTRPQTEAEEIIERTRAQRTRLTTGPDAYFAGFTPVPEAEIASELAATPDALAYAGALAARPAPRPLRVYVAGGSSEAELVARYIATLRAAGVEVTYDWTADVLEHRAAGSPQLTAEQRAAHARADLDGIEGADVVWWILPAALSEGSAFKAGYALGRAKRSVVSGAWAEHGRVFPLLLSELWSTHDAALAAIVSLAAERRKGGAP